MGPQQLAQVIEGESRLRLGGETTRYELHGVLDLIHRAGCHGIKPTCLTTDSHRRYHEHQRRRNGKRCESDGAQIPMRWASCSRWYAGSPKSNSLDFARLK